MKWLLVKKMHDNNSLKAQIINEIYDVILQPERYDHFMELWERHISSVIKDLDPDQINENSISKHIDEPELEAHFQRVYQILEKMGRENKIDDSVKNYGKKRSEETFFVNQEGQIIDKNKAAEQLIGKIDELKDLPPLIDKADHQKIQSLLLCLDRPNISEQAHIFRFHKSKKSNNNKSDEQFFIARVMQFSQQQPALVCISNMAMDWNEKLEKMLSDAFNLTSSELEIVHLLCRGLSLDEIAKYRNRSLHTIRHQIKSMLQKTATNSQADLVRMIVTMASFGSIQKLFAPAFLAEENTQQQIVVKVKDDRDIPVHQLGAKDGRPVIYIHGMLAGINIEDDFIKLLIKNNIKMIAPIRPHFANSPPAYNIKSAPEEFAMDLLYILDYFEITSAPIIGHMAGSFYAFACAAILPDRISGVLSISGGIPITSLRQITFMSPRQRVIAWTARFAPKLLPTILRSGISLIDSGKEDKFVNGLYRENTHDRMILKDKKIRTSLYSSYLFAVMQGHRAFEIDAFHITKDWSKYVKKLQHKAFLMHGTMDPVASISSVREFSSLYENIELIEHEDAGHLIFYQKPKAVISTLSKLLES